MKYPIFISYSRTDGRSHALKIMNILKKAGIEVWVDNLIAKGALFPSVIEQAIKDCKIVILVVTHNACLTKSYVHKEYQLAKAGQKRIVPFFFISTESVEVPPKWKPYQRIDFINSPEEVDDFIIETNDLLEGKVSPDELNERRISTAQRLLDKGITLYRQEAYDEAVEAFKQAMKPTQSLAGIVSYNLGQALYQLGKYEEAIKAYNRSLYYYEDSTDTWYNKGVALYELELYSEALEAFKKAIEKSSDNADAWYNKGLSLENLNRYVEALAACEQAATIDPASSDVYETIYQLKEIVNNRKKRNWLRWFKK